MLSVQMAANTSPGTRGVRAKPSETPQSRVIQVGGTSTATISTRGEAGDEGKWSEQRVSGVTSLSFSCEGALKGRARTVVRMAATIDSTKPKPHCQIMPTIRK